LAYKISISPRAQKEIENAIDYYVLLSVAAPQNFVTALKDTYHTLSINPFFRVRYRNVSALKIEKFPYELYFVINKDQNSVKIVSCFHSKLNPNKRPT